MLGASPEGWTLSSGLHHSESTVFVVDKRLKRSSAKESVSLLRQAYQSICSTADAKKIRLGLWAGTPSIKVIKVSPSMPRTMAGRREGR